LDLLDGLLLQKAPHKVSCISYDEQKGIPARVALRVLAHKDRDEAEIVYEQLATHEK
jgi:hypothetical protein